MLRGRPYFFACAALAACGPAAPDVDAGPPGDGLTWSTPENISESMTFSDQRLNWGQGLAVTDAGVVVATWREVHEERADGLVAQVVVRRSEGDGWRDVATLSDLELGVGHPKVAASGSHVYVVWHRYDPDPARDDELFVAISSDEGATFGAPTRIVDDALVLRSPIGELSSTPSIAAHGESVYVVWGDERFVSDCGQNVPEIQLQASSDRGASWLGVRTISSLDCRSSWTPTVSAFGDALHVAWTDTRHNATDCALDMGPCAEEEYYRQLTDHGASAGPEVRLSDDADAPAVNSWAGSIASDASDVHYAWMDESGGDNFEVHYRGRLEGGDWGETIILSQHAPGCGAVRPAVAVEGSSVHVAWFELCGEEASVSHRFSRDRGRTWSSVSTVTPGSGRFAIQPSIAVRGGVTHMLFTDRGEMYYARGRISG